MSTSAVARRYGGSLFAVAKREGILDEIDRDFDLVVHLFKDYPRIRRVYEDKKIYAGKKMKLFGSFFRDLISPAMLRFLYVVIENYREEYLFDMGREFLRLYRQEHNIVEARITTAVPLTEENRRFIEDELSEKSGRQVVLRAKLDPELLGGAVLRFGDLYVDDSLKTRLKELETGLLIASRTRPDRSRKDRKEEHNVSETR